MGKYSREPVVAAKAAKGRANDIRMSYKNTYEVAGAIRGMNLKVAQTYLQAVLEHKRVIPFRKHCTVGRTAQAKEFKATNGRWPEKSVKYIINLLKNVESNA